MYAKLLRGFAKKNVGSTLRLLRGGVITTPRRCGIPIRQDNIIGTTLVYSLFGTNFFLRVVRSGLMSTEPGGVQHDRC